MKTLPAATVKIYRANRAKPLPAGLTEAAANWDIFIISITISPSFPSYLSSHQVHYNLIAQTSPAYYSITINRAKSTMQGFSPKIALKQW